ncbi:MAG: Gfo/Idh/MocA family oxidoreductase [Turneriella sp.]
MFKISLIGCGRIAWQLEQDPLRYKPCTHLGAIKHWQQKNRRIQVVSLCDKDTDRAKAAAVFLSAPAKIATKKPDEALATQPDLLVIAASTDAHFPLLKRALEQNIPRIVLEKPVAFSQREARSLRKLLSQTQSVILPNYERRYHPKYIRLKAQLAKEKRPGSYRAFFAAGGRSLYADKRIADEGVLLHDTTHLVDLAQFLYGPVKSHRVIAGKRRHFVHLEHLNGAEGVIETALGIGVFHLELELHLSKERITVGNGFLSRERIAASPHYKALRSYANPVRTPDKPFPLSKNPFISLYRQAIFGHPTNAHFLEALDNVRILSP